MSEYEHLEGDVVNMGRLQADLRQLAAEVASCGNTARAQGESRIVAHMRRLAGRVDELCMGIEWAMQVRPMTYLAEYIGGVHSYVSKRHTDIANRVADAYARMGKKQ